MPKKHKSVVESVKVRGLAGYCYCAGERPDDIDGNKGKGKYKATVLVKKGTPAAKSLMKAITTVANKAFNAGIEAAHFKPGSEETIDDVLDYQPLVDGDAPGGKAKNARPEQKGYWVIGFNSPEPIPVGIIADGQVLPDESGDVKSGYEIALTGRFYSAKPGNKEMVCAAPGGVVVIKKTSRVVDLNQEFGDLAEELGNTVIEMDDDDDFGEEDKPVAKKLTWRTSRKKVEDDDDFGEEDKPVAKKTTRKKAAAVAETNGGSEADDWGSL